MLSELTRTITEFLNDLQIGEPWKLDEKKGGIIVPLARNTTSQGRRDYVVLEEVREKVTIKDLGSIDRVRMKNSGDKPVFVRGGGILKGMSTQSRGTQFGVIIMPDKEQAVPVLCIHASRGIISGDTFTQYGYAPSKISEALRSESQLEAWNRVSRWTRRCKTSQNRPPDSGTIMLSAGSSMLFSAGPTACESDNLVRAMDSFKDQVDEALRRVPGDLPDQVGMAILSEGSVVGVEAFDDPASWLALSRSVVRQYKDVLDREDPSSRPVNQDELAQKIKLFLENAKKSDSKEVFCTDISKTLVLRGEEVVGEITMLNDKPIHFLLTSSNVGSGYPEDHYE